MVKYYRLNICLYTPVYFNSGVPTYGNGIIIHMGKEKNPSELGFSVNKTYFYADMS